MADLSENGRKWGKAQFVDAENFLRLLELEVIRCRRYQNFFCLLLVKISGRGAGVRSAPQEFIYRKTANILAQEIRESDVIGLPTDHCLAVILPYGDRLGGEKTRERIEETLRYYELKKDGCELRVELVCFPENGSDTAELMKKIKTI